MKKYFTKYIPADGEIKEGDMVLDTLSGEIVCWWDGNNWDKYDKKVKLFLCSRDIQVGDTVTHDSIPGVTQVVDDPNKFINPHYITGQFLKVCVS